MLDVFLPVSSHRRYLRKSQGMECHTVADAETIAPNQGGAA